MKKGALFFIMAVSVVTLVFSQQVSWTVNNTATWGEAVNRIRGGGNNKTYTITVSGTIPIPITPNNEITFGSVTGITVVIEGNGTISRSGGATGSLLLIGTGQTVIVRNLTLHGGNISSVGIFRIEGNTALLDCDVAIGGGTFTMLGDTSISGTTTTTSEWWGTSNNRAVRVTGGTFTMQDNASISGSRGGGVSIGSNGTFIMRNNATISNNTSGSAAGVSCSGTFIMEGGTISGNIANGGYGDNQGGAGVSINGGSFTMRGGTISGNNDRSDGAMNSGGGGVRVASGTFTMLNNALITGNTSRNGGGGVYIGYDFSAGSGTFIMEGGTISGNTSSRSGGGVSVAGNSSVSGGSASPRRMFTMKGGTISGNRANGNGGGVSLGSGNPISFSMESGIISGNTAGDRGGGVFGGNFTKTGGTIYGNDANPSNLGNRATSNRGHAIIAGGNWRNATAGQGMNSGSYGFWLNEDNEEVVSPPSTPGQITPQPSRYVTF